MFGGRQSFGVSDYFHKAMTKLGFVVLLEEIEALANLDEIIKVPDIDVFFVHRRISPRRGVTSVMPVTRMF
ncbi:MAG: hypothetical protein CM1200mP22_30820 [Dehalococcoidia bacterium]|nr:MAG: hypothetical protein CM1200mP22_30820 [Dehalococcoidia bacterium]